MTEEFRGLVGSNTALTDQEVRRIFGEDAQISRVGRFNLIHLDAPSPEEIEKRVEEFDPNDFFLDDCPLCQMLRTQGGSVVYDDEL